ncbi:GNAT family N-acetyltransferase [Flavobacterium sp. ANB]|uniref:GNAT family N-acetyltransferase n=1 Tax=unclassified Flavobacterium TaxID=196869 RepID=UPI0012B787C3|nr:MULTISPECIES: GNAT family N-acetyltransferase [unclassified Flavobacterium]MBF4515932.1 GNAT family N-acetyltransferase [Flavobacterium sp. ANB]MTD68934.1 GNAT family N-acetyltransferase [Flavobacterium sp. LC2016-13]
MLQIFEKRKDHIPDLQRIYLEVRRKTFHWLEDVKEYNLTDFERDTQGEFILVAVYNDEVAGFISLWMSGNFIHHLYIDEKYQGKNIGTKLLDEAIKVMNSPITLKCLAKNTNAIQFYESKGFTEKEKAFSNHGQYILYELTK